MSWAVDGFVASLAGASGTRLRPTRTTCGSSSRGPSAAAAASPDQLDHTTLRRYLAYLDDASVRAPVDRPQGRGAAGLPPVPPPPRRDRDRSGPVAAHAEGRRRACPACRGRRKPAPCSMPRSAAELEDDDAAGAATAWRDLAVLEVLYGAGLRVSECCGLTLRVGRHGPRAPHGARQGLEGCAACPLGEPATAAVRGYLAHGRAELVTEPTPPDAVFLNAPGPALTTRDARRIVAAPSAARRPDAAPARAPPRVRDAPARGRRRPPGRAGAARPRRPRDDPDLHPPHPRPPPSRLRRDASPCLNRATSRRRRSPSCGASTRSTTRPRRASA